jgi:hypothetical protein
MYVRLVTPERMDTILFMFGTKQFIRHTFMMTMNVLTPKLGPFKWSSKNDIKTMKAQEDQDTEKKMDGVVGISDRL